MTRSVCYCTSRMVERVKIAGGVIVNQKGEILLVHNHETDSWTYPKGHIDAGEDLLDGAYREIFEEVGIEKGSLRLVSKLPIYERATRQQKNKIKEMHMFLFTSINQEVVSKADEIGHVKWVPLDEVVDHFSYQEEVDFFKSIKPTLEAVG